MTDHDLRSLLRAHVEASEPTRPVSPDRTIALGHTRIRRRRTWLMVGAAAVVVAVGLGASLPHLASNGSEVGPASPAPSTSTGRNGPLKLLPPSCTAADHIRLGKETNSAATGWLFTTWPLLSDHPCTLYGYPSVKLLEASGKAPELTYKDAWPWAKLDKGVPALRPVVVNDTTAFTIQDLHKTITHVGATISIEKFRCDTTPHPKALTEADITLPIPGARALVGTTHYRLCDPADDGQPAVYVSPVQSNAKPRPYAVNLRSSFLPRPWPYSTPTWGTADMDGDGRPDTVVLHPRGAKPGLLVVHLATGKTLRATTEFGEPLRLQALSDLNGDGRAEILVSTTSLGADYHGVFANGVAEVFTVVGGRLQPVMRGAKPWRLDFALDGEGGVDSGVICHGDAVTQVTAVVRGKVARTTFRIQGDQAVRINRTTGTATGNGRQYAVSSCPGMSSDGWAASVAGVHR